MYYTYIHIWDLHLHPFLKRSFLSYAGDYTSYFEIFVSYYTLLAGFLCCDNHYCHRHRHYHHTIINIIIRSITIIIIIIMITIITIIGNWRRLAQTVWVK
jgi:uncharacterized membrane protein YesL